MKQQWFWLFFAGMSAFLGTVANLTNAQAPVITVALPVFWQGLISDEIVADFEAEHGVDVQFTYSNQTPNNLPTSTDAIEDYAQELSNYFNSADVLYVEAGTVAPEVTRAGYVIDLMPLISTDAAINPNDFHATAWDSFQWDGGFWAVPVAVEPLLINYNVDAFDAKGLSYPTSAWTLDDFANAARALTEYDESGNVTLAGMVISDNERNVLFRALLGQGFYDSSAFPEQPSLTNNPDLASLIASWNELLEEGVIATNPGGFFERFNEIPLQMGGGSNFAVTIAVSSDESSDTPPPDVNFNQDAPTRALAPLPNNATAVSATGFAISTGSSNPELAYQLARYLSEKETLANAVFGAEPARLSYAAAETSDTGGQVVIFGGGENSPEDQAVIDDALANGLPAAEMRFSQYISLAFDYLAAGDEAATALEAAEVDAVTVVQAMDDLEVALTVATPVPVVLAEGEIEISFGYQSFVQPLPNEADWDSLIADFVAQDPQVGNVNLELVGPRFGNQEDSYDCSYYPSTQFIDIDPETLYAIDPLLFSDANYDVNDLAAGALEIVQVEGMTYGLPITLQPSMLQYNPDSFAQVGLNEPVGGWTVSEFGDALAALDSVVADDEYPFVPAGMGSQYLLMLIAAQGALPIDSSTNPPTIDFSSPETVEAIRTVLDWAKAGYIEYQALGENGGVVMVRIDDSNAAPISSTFFAGFANPNVRMTTYPSGAYVPVSFDVGAGFINSTSAYPEACYRWLSYLATHPAVITGSMPALLSTLNQADVQDALGVESVAAYQTMGEMLSDPNAVLINEGNPFLTTWLNRAFDAYVLEDADLATVLQEAEQPTRDYLSCSAGIEFSRLTFQALQDCVSAADTGN